MQVLLRADASVAIGTGHIMRCMALAQALQSLGHEPHFAAREIPDSLKDQLATEGMRLTYSAATRGSGEDLKNTLENAKDINANCVVLDGYAFGKHYQETIRGKHRVCVIDDCAFADGYSADVLVNPNLFGTEEMYLGQAIDRLLIGHKYAILRKEFWDVSAHPLSVKTRRVLVTMGGSDPDNVTGKVVRALKKVSLEHVEVRAIVGASNPYGETLRVQASREGHPVELLKNVRDMREQYDWCDICIAAGGNTSLELARMGVPSLFIILVDNQEPAARAIRKHGFGRVLGWHEGVDENAIRTAVRDLLVSTEERDRMSEWGRQLIDGQGAHRVAAAIVEK